MKKLVIIASVLALAFSACQTTPAETNENAASEETKKVGKKIRTESDTLSYAVGVDLGSHLKNNIASMVGDDLNKEMVFAAIRDIFNDKQTLTRDEAYNFLNEYFAERLPQKQKAAEDKFFADLVKKNPAVRATESGLHYEIIVPGSDVKATSLKDQVRVMYRGTMLDGTEFDSSYERGDTAQFALNAVIKGWGEGLQLVGEGGKIRLWIPSELAYGQQPPYGSSIKPNSTLLFDVELFEVIPTEETNE